MYGDSSTILIQEPPLQVTTSYANQIAQLKARLMEKDAQLMGGFGNPVKLQYGDWSEPPFTPAELEDVEMPTYDSQQFGLDALLRGLQQGYDTAF
jgi:hypothetical protein